MKKLNLKLKANLKQQIEKDKQSGGKKRDDPRFLNYYKLGEGEKIKVLFIPDVNGNLWTRYHKHTHRGGGEGIECIYRSQGKSCPACRVAFDLKDAGNAEEAKKWYAKDYCVASVLVLESAIEVEDSPDGNQVKLIYVPQAIKEIIEEAVLEGQIEEDEVTQTPFIIKKTINDGGFAQYNTSYFSRNMIDDDDLAFFDDLMVEQYDFDELDIVPKPSTEKEVQEWVDAILSSASSTTVPDGKEDTKSKVDDAVADTDENDVDSSERQSKSDRLKDRLRASRSK